MQLCSFGVHFVVTAFCCKIKGPYSCFVVGPGNQGRGGYGDQTHLL